uniref:Putative polyadenylation factor i complex subunit fip1 n=1 Tax=Panstrongylus lignarius TaxID=156445 RepID=A0A224XC85_9HEMI
MADVDDSMNEDQWLYGDSTNENEQPEQTEKSEQEGDAKDNAAEELPANPFPPEDSEANQDTNEEVKDSDNLNSAATEPATEQTAEQPSEEVGQEGQKTGEAEEEEEEEEEEDDSDDDVHVTIGDIKTAPQYTNLNIKRGAVLSSGIDKLNKQQPGKFSIEEFESIGSINGIAAHEFSIDALEEKPWRKPGADITDYFNYGFNEETWRAYCERQKQMRVHESGVGLGGLGVPRSNPTLTIVNDNSKYASMNSTVVVGGPTGVVTRKAGPPPGPRRCGVIDVIGSSGVASRRTTDSPPKENAIQVMTADRRDYGRKGFDLSVPPPGFDTSQPPMPSVVTSYPTHTPYNPDFYNADVDPYYQSYEPTQEVQWSNQNNSVGKETELPGGITIKQEPIEKSMKEKERDRERHKERHRHRSRSRSGDRERRSRKHKSRSRSPGHRSHKKKKSKKSDRSKEGSD